MQTATLTTFGEVPGTDEIFMPSEPLQLRNNCQSGNWMLDGDSVGNTLSFIVVKYRQFYGDLGKTQDTFWGELHAYPLGCENIPPCLFKTFTKTTSLRNLNSTITRLLASKKNPAMGVFTPVFTIAAGTNDRGEPITYYFLKWVWEPITPADTEANELVGKLAEAVQQYDFKLPTDGNLVLLPSDSKGRDNAIASFKASKAKQLTAAK